MKKQLVWAVLGAAALCSCTETEVVEESMDNAIGFTNVVKKASRAEAVVGDLEDLDNFRVFAYYISDKTAQVEHPVVFFNDQEVTRVEEVKEGVTSTSWTYSPTRYWIPNYKYYFYAYSCADIALAEDKSKGEATLSLNLPEGYVAGKEFEYRGLKINDYLCNKDHQHDLVCASQEGMLGKSVGDNTKVSFQFKHALCKVSAEFQNAFPAGYTLSVSDVELSGFYEKADLEVRTMTWSNFSKTEAEATPALGMDVDPDDVAADYVEVSDNLTTSSLFMLPYNFKGAAVGNEKAICLKFKISVKQGDDEFLNRTIKAEWNPKWEVGHAYRYVIVMNGENALLDPIVFEATQSLDDAAKWEESTVEDITFSLDTKN